MLSNLAGHIAQVNKSTLDEGEGRVDRDKPWEHLHLQGVRKGMCVIILYSVV
jgi:hypothetical protein